MARPWIIAVITLCSLVSSGTSLDNPQRLFANLVPHLDSLETLRQQMDKTSIDQDEVLVNTLLQRDTFGIKEMEAILSSPEPRNVSKRCAVDLGLYLKALGNRTFWALKMLDSNGKLPSGVLEGNFFWMGSYKECLSAQPGTFKPHFCDVYSELPILLRGICMPDSCSSQDLQDMINTVVHIANGTNNVSVNCMQESIPLDTPAIAMICVLSLIGLFMLVGTLYDLLLYQPWLKSLSQTKIHLPPVISTGVIDRQGKTSPTSTINGVNHSKMTEGSTSNIIHSQEKGGFTHKVINNLENGSISPTTPKQEFGAVEKTFLAFSVYTNGKKLLNTAQSDKALPVINGIRFLSMGWVILGHTVSLQLFISSNWNYSLGMVKQWSYEIIVNGTYSVDTFFMLSGTLATYLLCLELKKRGSPSKINWALVYFHRFWRLTPPYMIIIGIWVALLKYWINGPMWPYSGGDPDCEKYWWTNLLYINNLVHADTQCLTWSWYLANDMQFFILLPLMVVPLFLWWKIGVAIVTMLLLVNILTTGLLVSLNDYPPHSYVDAFDQKDAFTKVYVTPWCRIGPYLIGVFLGYILYATNRKVKMNWVVVTSGWILATGSALSVIYGLSGYGLLDSMDPHLSAFYISMSRPVWAAAVAWVIFACTTGYGGFVNSLLSWSVFVPLGRLTYMAYLWHLVIISWFVSSRPSTIYIDDAMIIYLYLAHLVLAYAMAFLLSLALESPTMGLEKVFLPTPKEKVKR